MPEVVKVAMGVPYALGQTMVLTLEHKGGNAAVDRAFRTPPTSDLGFMDPTTALRVVKIDAVPVPPLPPSAERLGKAGPMGPWVLYLALAASDSAADVLHVADQWRGDTSITYRDGARTCVRVDIVGATPAATTSIRDALTAWAVEQPALGATVTDHEGRAEVTACDPGAAAAAPADAVLQHALSVATFRDALLVGMMTGGPPSPQAKCIADALVADPEVDGWVTRLDAGTGDPAEFRQLIQAKARDATVSCVTA